MKTKQDIINEILSSRLTANDIHLFSERMIPMTQCHDLLRSGKMSIPTALLLRVYAERVGCDSVDDRKKSFDTLITPDIERMAAIRGDYDRAALESVLVPTSALSHKDMDVLVNGGPEKAKELVAEAKKSIADIKKEIPGLKTASEIPAKKPLKLHVTTVGEIPTARSVTLQPFAANTLDDPMTRKMKSDKGSNYWVLYCKKNKYRLELADAECSIVTEEGTFVLSGFAERK